VVEGQRHAYKYAWRLNITYAGRDRLTLDGYDRDFARMWDVLGRELAARPVLRSSVAACFLIGQVISSSTTGSTGR
jgi:hypothetical protein